MIGSTLGIYRVVEKIRDGGAGTVWKAQGPKGDVAAIKMISEAWNDQKDRRKAFKREAEIMQRLAHPAIVRIFEYVEGPPRPYIVMEYFPSDNLKFTLWHKQQFLENRRMLILKQAAEGLAYIHTQGVVHKDVKPENLLVNHEGSLRLIDFSIAQTKWDRFTLFGGRKVDGTPLYMSPEQIRNETLDGRSDIYSLGVVIFEVMTRRPPYIGASIESILAKHMTASPPSMRPIGKDIPEELDTLVTKMLAKKAADRPSEMGFVLATLNRLAKKEEETLARMARTSTRVRAVGTVGTAGSTPVPAARAASSRKTPNAMPAVPGATGGAPKPPSSSSLPSARESVSKTPTKKIPPPGTDAPEAASPSATPAEAPPAGTDGKATAPPDSSAEGAPAVAAPAAGPGVPSGPGTPAKQEKEGK